MLAVSDIEVVNAAPSHDLTTLEKVKERLGITDTSADVLLANLITEVSAQIASYTGRVFASERVIEHIFSSGSHYLTLSRTPVSQVHSVTLDGEAVSGWELWKASAGFLFRSAGWGRGATSWWPGYGYDYGHQRYAVEYTGGYLLPGAADRDLPHDLEAAAIEMVVGGYQGAGEGGEIESLKVDDLTVRYAAPTEGAGLPPSAKGVLGRYRRVI